MRLNFASGQNALDSCSSSVNESMHSCQNALQALVRILRNESGSKGLSMLDSDMLCPDQEIGEASNYTDPLLRANTVFSCKVFTCIVQYNSKFEWLNACGTSSMTIAGGLGILGSLVARWGSHFLHGGLVLLGRTGRSGTRSSSILAPLMSKSSHYHARVQFMGVDVASAESVSALGHHIADLQCLEQVICHCTGQMQDALFGNITSEHVRRIMSTKLDAIKLINHSFSDMFLNFQVGFGSAVSVIGSPGQGTYSMSNACIDGYLASVKKHGSPTFVISWGAWADQSGLAGMAQQRGTLQRLERAGISPLQPSEGLIALHHIMFTSKNDEYLSHVLAARLNWSLFAPVLQRSSPALRIEGSSIEKIDEFLATVRNITVASEANVAQTIEGFDKLQSYCNLLLLQQLQIQDTCLPVSTHINVDKFAQDIGIEEKYMRLFRTFIEILERNSWLERTDEEGLYRVLEVPQVTQEDILTFKTSLVEQYPYVGGHVHLVSACAENYWPILTGKVPATEIIFPGGSNDLVEPMYKNNPLSDIFNEQVTSVVLEYLKKWSQRKVRILEIGAGTGGTSANVLRAIAESKADVTYVYTDVSSHFLAYGRKTFGVHYPFMEFALLDVEQGVSPQGFRMHSFDILVQNLIEFSI